MAFLSKSSNPVPRLLFLRLISIKGGIRLLSLPGWLMDSFFLVGAVVFIATMALIVMGHFNSVSD